MKYRIGLLCGLFVLILLSGCASSRNVNDPTNSLVFGFIDMTEAPTNILYCKIPEISPSSEGSWGCSVSNGLFYNQYLPLGNYQVTEISGEGFMGGGKHRYSIPRQGNPTSVRISKPGIYFLGSYKYKNAKTGIFEQGKFSIEKLSKPTQVDLLKRLLETEDIKNTAWVNKIRARLAELKS